MRCSTIAPSRPTSTCRAVCVTTWIPVRSDGGAAFGIEGLAPQFFNFQATAYARDAGHFAGRVVGSYDLLLTQRLIAQPEIEINFYSKQDPSRAVGTGLSEIDTGLRIRYELSRKFAPYVGSGLQREVRRNRGLRAQRR